MGEMELAKKDGHAIVHQLGEQWGIEPLKVMSLLKSTVLKTKRGDPDASDAEAAAFLVVCNEYNLNPFIKQIYGFRSKRGTIESMVPIDGWASIVNGRQECDGFEFEDHHDDEGNLLSITCRMFRKDRNHSGEVTEYMNECFQDKDTWRKWPHRMLQHKAFIQCARLTYSLSGIYDEDEAERIRDAEVEIEQTDLSDIPALEGPPVPEGGDQFGSSDKEPSGTPETVELPPEAPEPAEAPPSEDDAPPEAKEEPADDTDDMFADDEKPPTPSGPITAETRQKISGICGALAIKKDLLQAMLAEDLSIEKALKDLSENEAQQVLAHLRKLHDEHKAKEGDG